MPSPSPGPQILMGWYRIPASASQPLEMVVNPQAGSQPGLVTYVWQCPAIMCCVTSPRQRACYIRVALSCLCPKTAHQPLMLAPGPLPAGPGGAVAGAGWLPGVPAFVEWSARLLGEAAFALRVPQPRPRAVQPDILPHLRCSRSAATRPHPCLQLRVWNTGDHRCKVSRPAVPAAGRLPPAAPLAELGWQQLGPEPRPRMPLPGCPAARRILAIQSHRAPKPLCPQAAVPPHHRAQPVQLCTMAKKDDIRAARERGLYTGFGSVDASGCAGGSPDHAPAEPSVPGTGTSSSNVEGPAG